MQSPEKELMQTLERSIQPISRSQLDVAERALRRVTFILKESKLTHDKIIGLNLEDIPCLADRVIQCLTFATSETQRKIRTCFKRISVSLLYSKFNLHSTGL